MQLNQLALLVLATLLFHNRGEIFATQDGEQCICVYDGTSGKLKSTIDSENFINLYGLAISNYDFLYVADCGGSKIHKLTTAGEYLDSFGDEGTDPDQLTAPYAIAVSPEGKIYVCDCGCRVQVFSSDCSLSHVIDGGGKLDDPEGLAFDLSGNVHVACRTSNSVVVFSPTGSFVRQYDQEHLSGPNDIAIDSSGFSIIANYNTGSLSIFTPTGKYIHSVQTDAGSNSLWGVAVSPYDGSIWAADGRNSRLLNF